MERNPRLRCRIRKRAPPSPTAVSCPGAVRAAACALFAAALLVAARAAADIPVILSQPVAEAPVIDGVLDEAAWHSAPPSIAFTQVEPVQGAEPSERTELRVLFDERHLYVAVRSFDTSPGEIRNRVKRRDADVGADDVVVVALDTFGQSQDGYFFSLTAGGARRDGLIESGAQRNLSADWDGLWHGRAAVDASGWTAEFAIPARTLAFDPGDLQWRMNVSRTIRRKQETLRWAGAVQGRPFHALTDFGVIRGLSGLRQGRGVTLTPFVSVSATDDRAAADGTVMDYDPGFDLVYQFTPSLAGTVTVNTDFAETEVDQRIVNLTRFPVSLPEKRAFFLQDAPLFAFGGIDYSPYPFFTRRIGLSADGQPVDLLGGLKLSGRIGAVSLGLLGVAQDEFAGVGQKDLFAGRIAYRWGENSSVGVLITDGEPRADGDNTALGVDFNHVERVFGGRQRLIFHSWLVQSDSDLAGDVDSAGAVQLKLEGEPWSGQLFFSRYGERYDPGLGFVSRSGIFEYFANATRRWRPGASWARTVDVKVQADYYTDLDGRSESLYLDLPQITVRNDIGDTLYLELVHTREVLREPFEIRPGNVIATGDYRWQRLGLEAATSIARPLSGGVELSLGEFYDGTRHDYEVYAEWRPSPALRVGGEVEWRDIRLPGGDFEVLLTYLSGAYSLSPDLTIDVIGQFDNVSDQLGVNARLRWTVEPGRDLFLVLNQGWSGDDDSRFDPARTAATVKLGWTFAL